MADLGLEWVYTGSGGCSKYSCGWSRPGVGTGGGGSSKYCCGWSRPGVGTGGGGSSKYCCSWSRPEVGTGAGGHTPNIGFRNLPPKGCSKPVLVVWGVGVVGVAVPLWRHSVLTAGGRWVLCPERNGDSSLNARRFLGTVADVWVCSLDNGYRQLASLQHYWVASRRRHRRIAQSVAGVVVGNSLDCWRSRRGHKTLSRTSDPKLKEMTLSPGVFVVVVDDHDDVQHWLHPPGLTHLQQDKNHTYSDHAQDWSLAFSPTMLKTDH